MAISIFGRTFPRPSSNVILSTSDLTFNDFTYDGMYAMSTSFTVNIDNARGVIAGRNVGGQTRLFVQGKQSDRYPVIEVTPPVNVQTTYNAAVTASSANRCSLVKEWGTAIYGPDSTTVDSVWRDVGGNLFDLQTALCFQNGKLFYGMQASYNVTNEKDRQIGAAILDSPSTGQCTPIGPWRTSVGPQQVGGFICSIPQALADTHFQGRTMATGSPAISGVNGVAFGLGMYSFSEPASTLAASNRTSTSDIAITVTVEARYPSTARMNMASFNLTRKLCDWNDPGNCGITRTPTAAGSTSMDISNSSLYCHVQDSSGTGSDKVAGGSDPYPLGSTFFYGYIGPRLPDNLQFYYSGCTSTSGNGTLTGIPTSGTGSITAPISSNTQITLGNYDQYRGGTAQANDGTWGPVRAVSDTNNVGTYYDYLTQMHVIQTAGGKSGVLCVAALPDTIAGSTNYGSDTTATHVWYGAGTQCPHGQVNDQNTITTGPQAASTVPWGFIYRCSDIAAVRNGSKTLAQLAPVDQRRLDTFGGGTGLPSPVGANNIGGLYFDAVTGKLHMAVKNQDVTSFGALYQVALYHRFTITG